MATWRSDLYSRVWKSLEYFRACSYRSKSLYFWWCLSLSDRIAMCEWCVRMLGLVPRGLLGILEGALYVSECRLGRACGGFCFLCGFWFQLLRSRISPMWAQVNKPISELHKDLKDLWSKLYIGCLVFFDLADVSAEWHLESDAKLKKKHTSLGCPGSSCSSYSLEHSWLLS